MEFGSIERELFIEAAPEIVFDVISDPKHVQEWWPDEARYERAPGAQGQISFGDCNAGGHVAEFAVLEVEAPKTFSFRWTHPAGEAAAEGNSLLVAFELVPQSGGTLLKMTETGFREMGWEAAVLEAQYNDHVNGWGIFLPRIAPYATSLLGRS